MKKTQLFGLLLCLFALIAVRQAFAQKIANIAGNWSTITKMADRNVREQWTIQQSGSQLSGTVKSDHGELSFTGTIDDVGFFRVDVKDGDVVYKVRATLDNDSLDGSITMGAKEHIWSAKKLK